MREETPIRGFLSFQELLDQQLKNEKSAEATSPQKTIKHNFLKKSSKTDIKSPQPKLKPEKISDDIEKISSDIDNCIENRAVIINSVAIKTSAKPRREDSKIVFENSSECDQEERGRDNRRSETNPRVFLKRGQGKLCCKGRSLSVIPQDKMRCTEKFNKSKSLYECSPRYRERKSSLVDKELTEKVKDSGGPEFDAKYSQLLKKLEAKIRVFDSHAAEFYTSRDKEIKDLEKWKQKERNIIFKETIDLDKLTREYEEKYNAIEILKFEIVKLKEILSSSSKEFSNETKEMEAMIHSLKERNLKLNSEIMKKKRHSSPKKQAANEINIYDPIILNTKADQIVKEKNQRHQSPIKHAGENSRIASQPIILNSKNTIPKNQRSQQNSPVLIIKLSTPEPKKSTLKYSKKSVEPQVLSSKKKSKTKECTVKEIAKKPQSIFASYSKPLKPNARVPSDFLMLNSGIKLIPKEISPESSYELITTHNHSPPSKNKSKVTRIPSKPVVLNPKQEEINHRGSKIPIPRLPIAKVINNNDSAIKIIDEDSEEILQKVEEDCEKQQKLIVNYEQDQHPNHKSTEITYSNGVKKIMHENGSAAIMFANGDVKDTFPDGKIIYHYYETKAIHTTFPGGMQVIKFASGQIEKHFKDGSKEITFPDGTVKLLFSNGEEQNIFSNGIIQKKNLSGVQVVEYPNGVKHTIMSDGKKIRQIPQGVSSNSLAYSNPRRK